jgi:hypothetical protein
VPAEFLCLKVGDRLVKRAVVRFDYTPEAETELPLVMGATIMVLDDSPDEEWWEGACGSLVNTKEEEKERLTD